MPREEEKKLKTLVDNLEIAGRENFPPAKALTLAASALVAIINNDTKTSSKGS